MPERDKGESSVLAGRRPVLELLRSGRAAERVLIADHLRPSQVVGEIRRRAESLSIPVRFVPRDEIDRVAGGLNHQGVAAITGRYRYTGLGEILQTQSPCALFLDGVTDPQNLGSLLRSADCAGFDAVVIPAHRSAAVTAAVRRVSAGASEVLAVARVTNLGRALDEARGAGLWIVGLDADAPRDLWSSTLAEPPVGLVLGAEDRGISKSVRARCDELVRIPQAGRIGSLNVAIAGALAMFEVARRRRSNQGDDARGAD